MQYRIAKRSVASAAKYITLAHNHPGLLIVNHRGWNIYTTKKLFLSSAIHIAEGEVERPTPLVFITAEFLSSHVWNDQVQNFQRKGYNCLVFTPNSHECKCVDDAADQLHAAIRRHKLTPPLLISHSFSTLVCQRYLESYPALGMIMINPIPPNPIRVIRRIRNFVLNLNAVDRSHFLEAHFQLSTLDDKFKHSSSINTKKGNTRYKFPLYIENFINDKDENILNFVNLEPHSCPVLVITTSGDKHLLTQQDIDELKNFYELADEYYVHLHSCNSRAPMVENIIPVDEIITQFIEDTT